MEELSNYQKNAGSLDTTCKQIDELKKLKVKLLSKIPIYGLSLVIDVGLIGSYIETVKNFELHDSINLILAAGAGVVLYNSGLVFLAKADSYDIKNLKIKKKELEEKL